MRPSIEGHVSTTTLSPEATAFSTASGLSTPTWNQMFLTPVRIASSTTPLAAAPLTNTWTTSIGYGTSATRPKALSPLTDSRRKFTGTTCIPSSDFKQRSEEHTSELQSRGHLV